MVRQPGRDFAKIQVACESLARIHRFPAAVNRDFDPRTEMPDDVLAPVEVHEQIPIRSSSVHEGHGASGERELSRIDADPLQSAEAEDHHDQRDTAHRNKQPGGWSFSLGDPCQSRVDSIGEVFTGQDHGREPEQRQVSNGEQWSGGRGKVNHQQRAMTR